MDNMPLQITYTLGLVRSCVTLAIRLPRLFKRYAISAVVLLNATPIHTLDPFVLITRPGFNLFLITIDK
jgi:hypothetical protein